MCPGTSIFEIHDLEIAADNHVAFSHCLGRCGSGSENGEDKASWMRITAGYCKRNENWWIVHEHWSIPFDMESGKALFALKP